MGIRREKKKVGIFTTKTVSNLPWKLTPLGVEFEHLFPSVYELNDPIVFKKATKHVLHVLEGVNRPGMINRLRDIHLLFHLSKLIDINTLNVLCESLSIPGGNIPQSVCMAMEMAKLSLIDNDEEGSQ